MESIIDISEYMPHGMCLLWQPWLVLLWAGSDTLIFLSYMAIPLALLSVVRARSDLQHSGLILLFAAFILLCGLTHLLGVVTLWWPIYPIVGVVKLATGIVSAVTAIVLYRLIPTLIAIPAHADLEEVNRQLREKIASHEAAEAELRAIKADLERRVATRTEDLKQANTKLAVVAREAVHRSKNLLSVVSSIARQSARGQTDIKDYVTVLQGRIDALAGATATVISGESSRSAEFRAVVESQLEPLLMTFGDRIQIEGPTMAVNSEGAQQVGLAVHELATNTQKYGALSDAEGRVRISWETEGEGADAVFVFKWSEDCSPARQQELRDSAGSFGVSLLTRVVPAMLQGGARRAVEDGCLVYELKAPVKALTSDGSDDGDVMAAARIVDADFGIA